MTGKGFQAFICIIILAVMASILFSGCGKDSNHFIEPCHERWGEPIHITFEGSNVSQENIALAVDAWIGVGYTFTHQKGNGNVRVVDMISPADIEKYGGLTWGETIEIAPGTDVYVLIHELGHVIGLEHIDPIKHPGCNIMNPGRYGCVPSGFTNADLDFIDSNNVCQLAELARKNNPGR